MKAGWSNGRYQGYKIEPNGDYRALAIYKGDDMKLELRVSGSAMAHQFSGLEEETVHYWLWTTGLSIVTEMEDADNPKIILIKAYDVIKGKLVKGWTELMEINN